LGTDVAVAAEVLVVILSGDEVLGGWG
jgi:hypothetical protein